jgi:hypothetical protein
MSLHYNGSVAVVIATAVVISRVSTVLSSLVLVFVIFGRIREVFLAILLEPARSNRPVRAASGGFLSRERGCSTSLS